LLTRLGFFFGGGEAEAWRWRKPWKGSNSRFKKQRNSRKEAYKS